MKLSILLAGACATVLAAGGCKKKGTGGGGSWLVGSAGLMANINGDGSLGEGYDLDADFDLLGITCRGAETAFAVGEQGAMLRTFDAGETWSSIDLATSATLRSVAAAGSETIYVAGDGVLKRSPDSGASWYDIVAESDIDWLSVVAGQDSEDAILVDGAGTVWRLDGAQYQLSGVANLPAAEWAAMSSDSHYAAVVGTGHEVLRSNDGGFHWRSVELGSELALHSAWVTKAGELTGVGDDGVIVRIDANDAVSVTKPAQGALRAVYIDSEGFGIAGGDDGEVLISHDKGASWSELPFALSGTVLGVDGIRGHL